MHAPLAGPIYPNQYTLKSIIIMILNPSYKIVTRVSLSICVASQTPMIQRNRKTFKNPLYSTTGEFRTDLLMQQQNMANVSKLEGQGLKFLTGMA